MPGRQVLFASALIASALAVSAPAQASQFAGNGTQTIVNGNGAFSDAQIPAGLFTDTIDFSLPSTGTAQVNVIYFTMMSGISNLSATFNGSALTFTPLAGGSIVAGGISQSVMAGPQVLKITGLASGNSSYSGNVIFSAVPEAATWLMMFAGIGFTGLAMRRRKAQPKVSYAF